MKNRNAIAKRQQKKHLQKLSKRKAEKPNLQKTQSADKQFVREVHAFEVSGLHNYWIAHVSNFLVSDYKTGKWRPVFDEIYEGDVPALDFMLQKLDTLYRVGDKDEYEPDGMLLLGWFLQPVDVKYGLFKKALDAVKEAYPLEAPFDAIQRPHEPVVWDILKDFQKILDTDN